MTTNVPAAAHVAPLPARPSNMLVDHSLHSWINDRMQAQQAVVLITSGHSCALVADADRAVRPIDPDDGAIKQLAGLAKQKLLKRLDIPTGMLASTDQAPKEWFQLATDLQVTGLKMWDKARKTFFDEGRGKPLSDQAIRKIWHDAGARCMFEGCGADLGRTILTTKITRIGYLAHIIAADKDGPRGDANLSFGLSDDPENVMLMCDEHHRYIDRIAEPEYQAARLNTMRANHVRFVRRQLDALAYARTQGVAFLGNVASIATAPSERDMHDAMLDQQLAPLSAIEYPLTGFHRDDRLPTDFWRHLLREHELGITSLVRRFDGTHPTQERTASLSVFPLTAVPLLFLCGRIVGEGRSVNVFQYDFTRGSFRWDISRTPQPPGSFYFDKPQESKATAEVLLSIELTADLELTALPPELSAGLQDGSVRWLRIRATKPDSRCIGHPDDLQQFTAAAREALAFAQDHLRAQRIHLFGIAPASSLFRYGQLLRPGHHSTHIFYDRADRNLAFREALTLTGHTVADAAPLDDGRITIKLR